LFACFFPELFREMFSGVSRLVDGMVRSYQPNYMILWIEDEGGSRFVSKSTSVAISNALRQNRQRTEVSVIGMLNMNITSIFLLRLCTQPKKITVLAWHQILGFLPASKSEKGRHRKVHSHTAWFHHPSCSNCRHRGVFRSPGKGPNHTRTGSMRL
jgi:hypothetical protein